jgi:DNA-binding transcriptional MerR regulator
MSNDLYIGAAARELSVSTEFLRALERAKRIPVPRRDVAGRRLYSQDDVALLKSIGVGERPRRLKRAEDVLEMAQ